MKIKKGLDKALIIIIVLAGILRFTGLMPNILHPDEGHIQIYSYELVKNILTKGDFNPHNFKYGSWTFYLQSLFTFPVFGGAYLREAVNTLFSSGFASKILGFSFFYDDAIHKYSDILLLFGRAQTALFGVLSVYVLYLIGKKLFGRPVGLLSALILAVTPLHVRDSHYVTTDILFIFFILVSVVFLIDVIQKGRWRDFVLSGFFIGISSTIRYFPLAILVFPIATIFSFKKKGKWFLKVAAGIVSIGLGLFVGLPFLFLDPLGLSLFMQDLTKYILPWYSTPLTGFVLDLFVGKLSSLKSIFVSLDRFRPVYASWLFFNAYGALPMIASLAGIFVLLFKSFKKWLILIIIPLFNFIYISFYVPSLYERLNLPTLPFLALFAGFFIVFVFDLVKKHKSEKAAKASLLLVTVLVVIAPLFKSSSASLTCGQKSIWAQSVSWVEQNIPKDARIGYVPMVSTPQIDFAAWVQLEPGREISLAEAQEKGLNYVFINASRLEYNTYSFFNSFFALSRGLYENSYYSLVLSEYQSRAKLLNIIRKPLMCDSSRIYYYQLPAEEKEATKVFTDLNSWQIKSVDKSGSANFSFQNSVLEYQQTPFSFTAPRIASSEIPIANGGVYTFSFWVRTDTKLVKDTPKVLARMDFYNAKKSSLLDSFKKLVLFVNDGPTPLFYEQSREAAKNYSDTFLPGKIVVLSPLAKVGDKWQKLSVTTRIPDGISYVVVSIQPIFPDGLSLEIERIELLGS